LNVAKEWPSRKPNRVAGKDYSRNGAYFLTICTKDRHELFGKVQDGKMILSSFGEIVQAELHVIEAVYSTVVVDSFVVMPNHVHILLHLLNEEANPYVSRIIQQWKGSVSKKAGTPLWQKLFHDHAVDTAEEFRKIQQYIRDSPAYWKEDVLRPLAEFP